MQNSSGWSNGDGKSGLKSYLLVHQLGPCCNFLGAIWEITTLGYSNALKDILSYQKMPWGQPKTRETHGLVFNTDDLVLVAQSCPTLCNSMDPLSMEFSGQEYWSRLPLPSLGESSWPRDQTQVSCIAGGFFTVWATREASWSLHKTQRLPYLGMPVAFCCFFLQFLWLQVLIHHELISSTLLSAPQLPKIISL